MNRPIILKSKQEGAQYDMRPSTVAPVMQHAPLTPANDVQNQIVDLTKEVATLSATLKSLEQSDERIEKGLEKANESVEKLATKTAQALTIINKHVSECREEIKSINTQLDTNAKVLKARIHTVQLLWGVILALGGAVAWVFSKVVPYFMK